MWVWYFYSAFGDVPIIGTGCIVARDIYQGGQKTAEVYLPGLKSGQAGC